jgi:hypothetical protein
MAAERGARDAVILTRAQGRRFVGPRCRSGVAVNLHLALTPLISLLAGILILVMPKLLNLIVAIYLILIGLVGLFGTGGLRV